MRVLVTVARLLLYFACKRYAMDWSGATVAKLISPSVALILGPPVGQTAGDVPPSAHRRDHCHQMLMHRCQSAKQLS